MQYGLVLRAFLHFEDKFHDGDYLLNWEGNNYPTGKANHPVTWVNWYSAMAYPMWARKHLPMEAEDDFHFTSPRKNPRSRANEPEWIIDNFMDITIERVLARWSLECFTRRHLWCPSLQAYIHEHNL